MKIAVIGNCQAIPVAECLALMTGFAAHRIPVAKSSGYDVVFAQLPFKPVCKQVVAFPRISYPAYMPDVVLATLRSGGRLQSPLRDLNSAIVLRAFLDGLSAKQAFRLFNEHVFRGLGYYDLTHLSTRKLLEEGDKAGISMDDLLHESKESGYFMHTFNHPKGRFIARLCEKMLDRANIPYERLDSPPDPLAKFATWPVYPDIARSLGLVGSYEFKSDDREGGHVFDLEHFIENSYEAYRKYDNNDIVCTRIDDPRFRSIAQYSDIGLKHPYVGIASYQKWSQAVKGDVDPVVSGAFNLSTKDKVGTAGSCFAQHIARNLAKNGFNYFITEREKDNSATYSARYGNIYTTRQLVQLVDRAYSRFKPIDDIWHYRGRLVDPFRPEIEPEGFASEQELHASRAKHFEAVRALLEGLDYFVFTLGLTEAWLSAKDGAVFPLAPGVSGGTFDPNTHRFHNFDMQEVRSDLDIFLQKLRRINSRAKVILTVSPVPLAATYEPRSVLASTAYSKAVLRVAAEEISKKYSHVAYFPSYEVITSNFNRGTYYDESLRNVTNEGVEHVMRLFFRHYTSNAIDTSLFDEAIEVICEEAKLLHV